MRNNELRSQYFDKGSAALRMITGIDRDSYCCPICARLYLPESLRVGALTLEHAPPKQLGGLPLALTCKECNSVAGYSVDSAVVERERLFDFTKAVKGQEPHFRGRGTCLIGGERLNIDLETDEGKISIKPREKINDPKKLKTFREYTMRLCQEGKWDGQEITITPKARYHHKHSKIGDLKTAFIICFAFLGYSFALNKRLSCVREQIINYTKEVIDRYWMPSDPRVMQEHFICFTQKPVTALAVKLDGSTVLLPWIEGPEDFYNYLADNYEGKDAITFQGRIFHRPRSLEMRLDFMTAHKEATQPIADKS
jgi:hypothetical protein